MMQQTAKFPYFANSLVQVVELAYRDSDLAMNDD